MEGVDFPTSPLPSLAFHSYGMTDLRTQSRIYPQVIDVCGAGGKLSGTDVSEQLWYPSGFQCCVSWWSTSSSAAFVCHVLCAPRPIVQAPL
jgi:hypothetical protein